MLLSFSRRRLDSFLFPLAFLGKVWSGQYFPRHPSQANRRFLSTERWVIDRCDGQQIYRIQYFGNDDHFWAQVAPTNVTSLITMGWVSFKKLFAAPR